MTKLILLGTHFMFREELGSRLRGEFDYTVHPYDNLEDLKNRINREDYNVDLVIVDLQYEKAGGKKAIKMAKDRGIKVLAIGEHKKKKVLDEATKSGADLSITNSQASNSIESYVKKLL